MIVIEKPMETGQSRRKVWCNLNDLTLISEDTYQFKSLPQDALGYGSIVYVIDSPGLVCYYDNTNGHLLKKEIGSGGGGGGESTSFLTYNLDGNDVFQRALDSSSASYTFTNKNFADAIRKAASEQKILIIQNCRLSIGETTNNLVTLVANPCSSSSDSDAIVFGSLDSTVIVDYFKESFVTPFTITTGSGSASSVTIKIKENNVSNNIIKITYNDLYNLVISSQLIPGMFYRITDYVTKIIGSMNLSSVTGTSGYLHFGKSAEHPFDIIVQATGRSTLNENAKAILHVGDTYFEYSNLDAWELKYDIRNNREKYTWADPDNGKGVIWWMKDEFGNEAGYDFKNVLSLRYALKLANSTPDYTPTDSGLVYNASTQPNRYGSPYHVAFALMNYMREQRYINPFNYKYKLSDAVANYDFTVGYGILQTTGAPEIDTEYLDMYNADLYYTFDYFDGNHYDASLNNYDSKIICQNNIITQEKDMVITTAIKEYNHQGLGWNVFETNSIYSSSKEKLIISDNCFDELNFSNTFGNNCYNNKFGSSCYGNIFGNDCYDIAFSSSCYLNMMGNDNFGINFGNLCANNSFGRSCYNTTLGETCLRNTLLNNCNRNIFLSGCADNTLCNNCHGNKLEFICHNNILEHGCNYNTIQVGSYNNTLDHDCHDIVLGNKNYSNVFGNGCEYITLGAECSEINFPAVARYITTIGNVDEIDLGAQVQAAMTFEPKYLINYTSYSSNATFIIKNGYNTETAMSTTDGGQTWTAESTSANGVSF